MVSSALALTAALTAVAALVVALTGSPAPTVPVLLVGVVVLLVVQLGWGTTAAGRASFVGPVTVRHAQSGHVEHRRLARDLRDGVLQDLAGVGYTLGAAELSLNASSVDGPAAGVGQILNRLGEIVRRDIRTLRQVLVDVQPPDLSRTPLADAVGDLTTGLRMTGVVCVVRVPEPLGLPAPVAGLLYRAAREALRNVGEHAHADRMEVVVALSARRVTLTVSDDGLGCDPAATAATVGGLAALRAAVVAAAGTLEVTGTPGHGTSVAIALPLPPTRQEP